MEALIEQLGRDAADWADPRIPALLSWMAAGERRSELQALLRSTSSRMHTLTGAHASLLIDVLKRFGMVELAYAVSALPALVREPELAIERARLAMYVRDYQAALAASDIAIAALLQPGVSIDEFLRLCMAGAPAEGMLRFERHVLADRAHLSERLALRWEALHRAGLSRDASLMQLMCQRYFPERASVWATAGNHALDGDDVAGAEAYFQQCLKLDPSWTAALAGLAIVHERRKDWAAALPYRQRVLETTRALELDDAASLQRRLRYAAALARLGQWQKAEPLFRSAARGAAIVQLPAEHPVLLRVFSQELYAPALVAHLLQLTASTHAASSSPTARPARGEHETPTASRPLAQAQSASAARGEDDAPDASRPLAQAQSAPAARSELDAPSASRPLAQAQSASAADGEHDAPSASRPLAQAQSAPAARSDLDATSASRPVGQAQSASAARGKSDAPGAEEEPAVALARHEAALLAQLGLQLTAAQLSAADEPWVHGLHAYLSGELEHAYELFDRAEVDRPEDLAVHYLLSRCASAIGHEQAASIRTFAEEAARALWAAHERTQPSAVHLGYALAILPELAPAMRAAGYSIPSDALEELEPLDAPVLTQLENIAAFRATHQAAGRSSLVAAAASTHALAAINA